MDWLARFQARFLGHLREKRKRERRRIWPASRHGFALSCFRVFAARKPLDLALWAWSGSRDQAVRPGVGLPAPAAVRTKNPRTMVPDVFVCHPEKLPVAFAAARGEIEKLLSA